MRLDNSQIADAVQVVVDDLLKDTKRPGYEEARLALTDLAINLLQNINTIAEAAEGNIK